MVCSKSERKKEEEELVEEEDMNEREKINRMEWEGGGRGRETNKW